MLREANHPVFGDDSLLTRERASDRVRRRLANANARYHQEEAVVMLVDALESRVKPDDLAIVMARASTIPVAAMVESIVGCKWSLRLLDQRGAQKLQAVLDEANMPASN